MAKQASLIEQLLSLMFESVDISWKIGAFLTAALVLGATVALYWAFDAYSGSDLPANDPLLLVKPYLAYVYFAVSTVFAVISVFFARKTIRAYERRDIW